MDKKKLIYIGSIALITILVSVTYFSYAFFTNKQEFHGKLNIVAGTLDYKVDSADLSNNAVSVPANSVKMLNIKVTSQNRIDSKYMLYYSNGSPSYVSVTYAVATTDMPSGTIGTSNTDKTITVIIKNTSSSAQTVTFGVQGGFTSKTISLASGLYSIPEGPSVTATELSYAPTQNPNTGSNYTSCVTAKCALDELYNYAN